MVATNPEYDNKNKGATCFVEPDEDLTTVKARPNSPRRSRKIFKPAPIRRKFKIGRNQKCPCGSGLKFKRCCGKGAT